MLIRRKVIEDSDDDDSDNGSGNGFVAAKINTVDTSSSDSDVQLVTQTGTHLTPLTPPPEQPSASPMLPLTPAEAVGARQADAHRREEKAGGGKGGGGTSTDPSEMMSYLHQQFTRLNTNMHTGTKELGELEINPCS